MLAGGIPRNNRTHGIDVCLAAMEIQAFMNQMRLIKKQQNFPYWQLRLGINTGPLVAGVIAETKFCQHHVCAGIGQSKCDAFADTATSAGDHGHLPIELELFQNVGHLPHPVFFSAAEYNTLVICADQMA